MAEPWKVEPSMCGPRWFEVIDDAGFSAWPTEKLARRYASTPLLIATIREACERPRCLFCGEDDDVGHAVDCPGIAALKAAGEEP